MLHFECDYLEGAHPAVLEALLQTNMEKMPGYGNDASCSRAKEKIRRLCDADQADIHFLSGGTQTNAVVIQALLKPWEGVLCASCGHINTHEAGAVEAGGHKVLPLPHTFGKLNPEDAEQYLKSFFQDENRSHMVHPGMIYLTHPTEFGALYTANELIRFSEICRRYHLFLYLDGARLGYGLASPETDVTLPLLARTCDAFYIGGTKVGALLGEAVVFPDPMLAPHFFTFVKQQGALLAKGRILGIQFDTLFTDDLYFRISRSAIRMAERLKEGLRQKGYRFYYASPTNQQFLIVENNRLKELGETVSYSYWEPFDDEHTIIRLATSWATSEKEVEQLLELL
ncbi:MAG TPA: low specificity L-threonine aldolase [Candidatus Pullilachnospira intestinigallinarum]|nr:low specificity L-threonine aldolase [Candidatus Pullilachnospira intestinigallinarum]